MLTLQKYFTATESEQEDFHRQLDSPRMEYNVDFISSYMSIEKQYQTPLEQIDYSRM